MIDYSSNCMLQLTEMEWRAKDSTISEYSPAACGLFDEVLELRMRKAKRRACSASVFKPVLKSPSNRSRSVRFLWCSRTL
jgi:hypothetical protein